VNGPVVKPLTKLRGPVADPLVKDDRGAAAHASNSLTTWAGSTPVSRTSSPWNL
jgi:hypothetical protein